MISENDTCHNEDYIDKLPQKKHVPEEMHVPDQDNKEEKNTI